MKITIFNSAFLLLLLLLLSFSAANANANTEEVCKHVVDTHHYDFCVKTLKSNHAASQTDNKKVLSGIIFDVALEKYHSNYAKIVEMKNSKDLGSGQHVALSICSASYSTGLDKLVQVMNRFNKGGFMAATNFLTAGMDKAMSCIDAIEKTGSGTLMGKDNEEALNLVILASKLMEKS